ncbi:MAG: hypothetical protein QF578_16345 [Alphaproteobacteria bacterium]|jgi:hypothetical protein|nr:hypothetical protein [Alphaproteobacteria bacterium]MDP6566400.1 hypothetical protein [Alphaproteobacteria bacterium]MDP6811642.1 hypothetical protein [Alphaproteobacteria bacterium]
MIWRLLTAVVLLTATMAVGPSPARADAGFLAGVSDLPLMPGLREVPEATVVFDKPDGRIVRATATGKHDRAEVLRFYAETLPQLGWRAVAPSRYAREGESLRIEARPGADGLTVRFSITPGQ